MKDKYRKRVDDFFEFKDKHNCERVYNAIKKIDTDYWINIFNFSFSLVKIL